MGNSESTHLSGVEWKFVGRKNDLEKIEQELQNARGVGIFGIRKIGKSRTAREVLKILQCKKTGAKYLYKDFEQDEAETVTLYECLRKFFDALKIKDDSFENLNKEHFQSCKNCKECLDNKPFKSSHMQTAIRCANRALINVLKGIPYVIIFLDNVDRLLKNDTYLMFLKAIVENSTGFKFVLTSTQRVSFTGEGKWFKTHELQGLETHEILELIQEVSEGKLQNVDEYAKQSINAVAKLCEGLPLAAQMAASELKSDNCLLEPLELVEILITDRLKGMSPDNYPADDRLDQYIDDIVTVQDLAPHFQQFFQNLNKQMRDDKFTIQDATKAANNDIASSAVIKTQYVTPLLKQHIAAVHPSQGNMIILHGVFRDCITTLEAIDSLSGEGIEKKRVLIRERMQRHARLVGLDVDDVILTNPKELERAIKESIKSPAESTGGGMGYEEQTDIRSESSEYKQNDSYSSISGPSAMSFREDGPEKAVAGCLETKCEQLEAKDMPKD